MSIACDGSRWSCWAADLSLLSEAVDHRCRVEGDDSGDGNSTLGDDNVVAVTRCVDPLTEMSPEFGDCDIHLSTVHHDALREVHLGRKAPSTVSGVVPREYEIAASLLGKSFEVEHSPPPEPLDLKFT